MRGTVPGLATPHPLGRLLPGLYQEDDFAQRFVAALDDALAPVQSTLDNLHAYVDVSLSPADFLEWLAGWVGVELEEDWDEARRRTMVAAAVDVHRRRGTVQGVRDTVRAVLDAECTVVETGAMASSSDPGAAMPGRPVGELVVQVRAAEASALDTRRLDRLLAAVKPAHIPHRIEYVGYSAPKAPADGPEQAESSEA